MRRKPGLHRDTSDQGEHQKPMMLNQAGRVDVLVDAMAFPSVSTSSDRSPVCPRLLLPFPGPGPLPLPIVSQRIACVPPYRGALQRIPAKSHELLNLARLYRRRMLSLGVTIFTVAHGECDSAFRDVALERGHDGFDNPPPVYLPVRAYGAIVVCIRGMEPGRCFFSSGTRSRTAASEDGDVEFRQMHLLQ